MASGNTDIEARVRELAEPLVQAEGMELVDVEYLRQGGRWLLRLTIDKPGGITLDDCELVSRQVERALDVEDPIATAYSLEVSSPGIERPLKKLSDFQRFAGRLASIRTRRGLGQPPRKNFKGRLLGLGESGTIRIDVDGRVHEVPFDEIAKANLAWDPDALRGDRNPDASPAREPEGE